MNSFPEIGSNTGSNTGSSRVVASVQSDQPTDSKVSLFFLTNRFHEVVNDGDCNCFSFAKKVLNIAYPIILAINLFLLPFIASYNCCFAKVQPQRAPTREAPQRIDEAASTTTMTTNGPAEIDAPLSVSDAESGSSDDSDEEAVDAETQPQRAPTEEAPQRIDEAASTTTMTANGPVEIDELLSVSDAETQPQHAPTEEAPQRIDEAASTTTMTANGPVEIDELLSVSDAETQPQHAPIEEAPQTIDEIDTSKISLTVDGGEVAEAQVPIEGTLILPRGGQNPKVTRLSRKAEKAQIFFASTVRNNFGILAFEIPVFGPLPFVPHRNRNGRLRDVLTVGVNGAELVPLKEDCAPPNLVRDANRALGLVSRVRQDLPKLMGNGGVSSLVMQSEQNMARHQIVVVASSSALSLYYFQLTAGVFTGLALFYNSPSQSHLGLRQRALVSNENQGSDDDKWRAILQLLSPFFRDGAVSVQREDEALLRKPAEESELPLLPVVILDQSERAALPGVAPVQVFPLIPAHSGPSRSALKAIPTSSSVAPTQESLATEALWQSVLESWRPKKAQLPISDQTKVIFAAQWAFSHKADLRLVPQGRDWENALFSPRLGRRAKLFLPGATLKVTWSGVPPIVNGLFKLCVYAFCNVSRSGKESQGRK